MRFGLYFIFVAELLSSIMQTLVGLKKLHSELDWAINQIHHGMVEQARAHENILFQSFQGHLQSIEKDLEHHKEKVSRRFFLYFAFVKSLSVQQADFDAGHWKEKKHETDLLVDLIKKRIEMVANTSTAV
jgi:ribosome-associated translation inhibitor RaiA